MVLMASEEQQIRTSFTHRAGSPDIPALKDTAGPSLYFYLQQFPLILLKISVAGVYPSVAHTSVVLTLLENNGEPHQ